MLSWCVLRYVCNHYTRFTGQVKEYCTLITHLTKSVVNEEGVETGSDELHFFYDAFTKPSMVEYEGEMYRYIYNLQGDIVAIVDAAGSVVLEYGYDAWGCPISVTDYSNTDIVDINVFKYRGYLWDCECGLYYVGDRYYHAAHNRFLNADRLICVGSENMFSYTKNQVVRAKDMDGLWTCAYGMTSSAYVGPFSYSIAIGICQDGHGNKGAFVTFGGLLENTIKELVDDKMLNRWPDDYNTALIVFVDLDFQPSEFMQITELDSIFDLNGISNSMGFVGVEILSSGSVSDMNNDTIGIQFPMDKIKISSLSAPYLSNQYTVVYKVNDSDIEAIVHNIKYYLKIDNIDYKLKRVYDPLIGKDRYVRIYD